MDRRRFIQLAGGATFAWPTLAHAQPASTPLVGFFNNGSPQAFATRVDAFRRGLGEAGFVEGQSVRIEYRWSEGDDSRIPELVTDLAQRKVSVITATGGTAGVLAVRRIAPATPLIFAIGADPVKLGIVKSFNKPEGNVTGVSFLSNTILSKQVAILHEAIGSNASLGFLVNPANPNAENDIKSAAATAEALGHKTIVAMASAPAEVAGAIASLVEKRAEALVIFPDALFSSTLRQLVELATKHRIPAIYNTPEFSAAGGLLSYGANQIEAYRQAGVYTGRVLKGEKPADLPIVQSTRFDFAVNLKTAKAFGITLSPTLLATVDQVFE
jgi:ABC-type uncharacterized transport system substrate-binding protein